MDILLQLAEDFVAAQKLGFADARTSKRSVPGIDRQGRPLPECASVVAEVLSVLGVSSPDVTVVLPARLIRSRRLQMDIPIEGQVRQTHVTQARDTLAAQSDEAHQLVLYRQPSGFLLDGVRGTGDPVGQQGSLLTVDAMLMQIDPEIVGAFEGLINQVGGRLADIVVPFLTVPAAVLSGAASGAVFHLSHGEVFLVDMQNHFIRAASSLGVGFRHLVSDVAIAEGCEAAEAAGIVRTLMKRVPTPNPTAAEQALDARLAEIATWIGSTRAENSMEGPLIFSGVLTEQKRLGTVWPDIEMLPSPLGNRGAMAPLLGGAAVLEGAFGGHVPARLTTGAQRYPGLKLWRWLKTHF